MPAHTTDDTDDMTGKVVLITGGTAGIGWETLVALAARGPSCIYFTGRNTQAADAVIEEATRQRARPDVRIVFIPCDLSWDRHRIRAALSHHFHADRLDLFIANAGIMATPPGLTAEGFEVQFGTNVLGHAILLHLLRPLMLRTAARPDADVRFIALSSSGHLMHPPGGIQFERLRDTHAGGSPWRRYGQSKLGGILLAKAMAQHHPQILSLAVHPGLVDTDLSRGAAPGVLKSVFACVRWLGVPVYQAPARGARNTLWAVGVRRDEVVNGGYYVPVGKRPGFGGQARAAGDAALREKLWGWVEEELRDLEPL